MTMKSALPKFRSFFVLLIISVLSSQLFAQTENEQSPVDGVSFRFIQSNGITMRIAEMGDSGPLLLLAHGWPAMCKSALIFSLFDPKYIQR